MYTSPAFVTKVTQQFTYFDTDDPSTNPSYQYFVQQFPSVVYLSANIPTSHDFYIVVL